MYDKITVIEYKQWVLVYLYLIPFHDNHLINTDIYYLIVLKIEHIKYFTHSMANTFLYVKFTHTISLLQKIHIYS